MIYDTIIIGAGPAGLTASIYASRYRLSNLVIGKLPGGTITYAHKVENFPGFISVSGLELAQKMIEQAKTYGIKILTENVGKIERSKGEIFKLTAETGKEFLAKTLIVATGTERRKLNVPGEKEYSGKGVSYCTTCDAPFFKNKIVVLIGGSNAACSGAIHLAEFAEKVYLIYRKGELRAEPVWVEEVKQNHRITVIYNTNVSEILGDGTKVTAVRLDTPYQASNELSTDGVFIEIGGVPASSFLIPLGVVLDEDGYVKVNEKMETNIGGLFAAGDLTTRAKILQQLVIACADGAIAAFSVFSYLKR